MLPYLQVVSLQHVRSAADAAEQLELSELRRTVDRNLDGYCLLMVLIVSVRDQGYNRGGTVAVPCGSLAAMGTEISKGPGYGIRQGHG